MYVCMPYYKFKGLPYIPLFPLMIKNLLFFILTESLSLEINCYNFFCDICSIKALIFSFHIPKQKHKKKLQRKMYKKNM